MCWCFSVRSCRVPFSILRRSHVRTFFHPPDKRRKKIFHRLVKSPRASKAEHPRHSPFTLRSQRFFFFHSSAFVDKHEQTIEEKMEKSSSVLFTSLWNNTNRNQLENDDDAWDEIRCKSTRLRVRAGGASRHEVNFPLVHVFPTIYMPQVVFLQPPHSPRKPNKNIFKNAQSAVPSRE